MPPSSIFCVVSWFLEDLDGGIRCLLPVCESFPIVRIEHDTRQEAFDASFENIICIVFWVLEDWDGGIRCLLPVCETFPTVRIEHDTRQQAFDASFEFFLCFVFWVLEDLDGGIRCLLPSIRKSRVPTHYLLCGNPSLPDGKCSSHSSCIFSDQRCCLRHVQEEVIVHWDCKSWSIGCLLCVRALVFVPITFVVCYLPTICADTKKVTL